MSVESRARGTWRRISDAVGSRTRGTDRAGGSVGLLDPERRVVPYADRDAELAGVIEWCRAPHQVQVRLTTGLGGVGKTRLAVEASRRMARAGWHCVWARPDASADAIAREAAAGRRVLVVVDDASARTDLAELLDGLPRREAGRLRVLLLARTGREWWYHLRWAAQLWLDGDVRTSHTHLTPPAEADEQAVVTSAARAFARRLGRPAPSLGVRTSDGRSRTLDLHAAALLAVIGGEAPGVVRDALVDPADGLDGLLDLERRRWIAQADRAGLPTDGVEDAVAAGMLLGTGGDGAARDALRRTAPVLATDQGVAWLRGLAGGKADIAASLPHRLVELHVVRRLAASPWLAEDWIREISAPTAHRVAVTGCGLQCDPPPDTQTALIDGLLHRVAREMPAVPDALVGVLRLLPQHPVLPSELAEVLTTRILSLITTPTAWADALTHRSRALWTLGRHAGALQVASEAVTAWRAVAENDPRRYGRCLARALCALGVARHGLGRYREALDVLAEALGMLRRISEQEAEWTQPELAWTLRALSATNQHLGRYTAHDKTCREEIAVLRRLVARDPAQFEAQLASALLGRLGLVDQGRPLEALEASTEALDLWRRLARRYDVEPQLAFTLSARSCVLAELGRLREAIASETEALEMRRHLAAAEPGRYDWELATSLAQLGALLSDIGRTQHAHALETEALAIRRRLARENPRSFTPALASSLSNFGVTCSRMGKFAEALPLEQEAVAIRRDLAGEAPERYELYLARSLSNLGVRYSDLGDPDSALAPTLEAVATLRRLTATDPTRHRPDLAWACTNLGATYADLGRVTEAVDLLTEAVGMLRRLAATYPARFRPGLARASSNLAALEITLGRFEQAVEHATEAVTIRRELVTFHGDRYQHDLDVSLAILDDACDPRTAAGTAGASR